jgi:hypothetical protein
MVLHAPELHKERSDNVHCWACVRHRRPTHFKHPPRQYHWRNYTHRFRYSLRPSNLLSYQDQYIELTINFQGKLLGVPERVPFRMTADFIDGMGTSGTSGVFQRCAEETLRVLREESDVIMTVLEVFKYDPLHTWLAFLIF